MVVVFSLGTVVNFEDEETRIAVDGSNVIVDPSDKVNVLTTLIPVGRVVAAGNSEIIVCPIEFVVVKMSEVLNGWEDDEAIEVLEVKIDVFKKVNEVPVERVLRVVSELVLFVKIV